MKKRAIILSVVLIICFLTKALSGCDSGKEKILYNSSLNKVNFDYSSDGVSFMLTFASTDKNIEVWKTTFQSSNSEYIKIPVMQGD